MKQLNQISIAMILSLVFIITSCEKNEENAGPLTQGKAPEFMLNSTANTQVKLSDFNNKVVVLFFFGNTCPSCMAAAPNIESMLVKPFENQTDYMVIGIDQWNGNLAVVEAFRKSTGVSFPLLLNGSSVSALYQTTFDRIVVINKSGDIAFSGNQGAASDIAAAKQKIEMLIDKNAVKTVVPTETPKDISTVVVAGNAPNFTLSTSTGSNVSLSDFKNKTVVLFFFGNTCSSCKAVAPNVESMLVKPFADKTNYMVLGIDVWNGNSALVDGFKTSTGVTFPLLLNGSGVAASYNTSYDRIVIIDKMGNIVFKGTQNATLDIASAKQKVEMLLAP